MFLRCCVVRLAIAARSRPEIDLPKYLGDYELSVVPRSMFSGDEEILLGNDKSVLIHEIERISASVDTPTITADSSETVTELTPRVIVFDGMAVVNQIKKTPLIKSCRTLLNVLRTEYCLLREISKKSESSSTNILLTR